MLHTANTTGVWAHYIIFKASQPRGRAAYIYIPSHGLEHLWCSADLIHDSQPQQSFIQSTCGLLWSAVNHIHNEKQTLGTVATTDCTDDASIVHSIEHTLLYK